MIMEILKFIFQDAFHLIGTIIMLAIVASMFRGLIHIDRRTIVKKDKENK